MQKHKSKQGGQINIEINHGAINVTNTHDTNILERMIKTHEMFNDHLGLFMKNMNNVVETYHNSVKKIKKNTRNQK